MVIEYRSADEIAVIAEEERLSTRPNHTISEDLNIEITDSPNESYTDFNIEIQNQGVNFSTPHKIYSGRAYRFNKAPIIHINDIIEPFLYDSKQTKFNPGPMWEYYKFDCNEANNQFFNIKVDCPSIGTSYSITNVLAYKEPIRREENQVYPEIVGAEPKLINLLSCNTDVLPVIPNLSTSTTDFYASGLINPNKKFIDTSVGVDEEGVSESQVRLVAVNKNGDFAGIHSKKYIGVCWNTVLTVSIPGNTIWDIQHNSQEYETIGLAHLSDDYFKSTYTPLFRTDKCNAEYYVIWQDRSGAYQCQPFHKKNTLHETIKSTNTINALNIKKSASKTVDYKWSLNSNWLTYDEYNAFESLFISPFVQLYDVKYNKLHDVVLVSNKWDEKNDKNNKKPFNLKIELEKARPENILC